MLDIHKMRSFIKKAFNPVTIMLILHSKKPLNLKIPLIEILMSIVLWFIGIVYVSSIAFNAFECQEMS